MTDIKNILHSINLKDNSLIEFGEKIHSAIIDYISPYISDSGNSENINSEINAIKSIMQCLQKHPDLFFESENYFEVVFHIKNTDLSLTLNFPFNVIERGSPAYFEYKIRTEDDIYFAEYYGSWQKKGIILSIRERLFELTFKNSRSYQEIQTAYSKAINNIYNSKTESEAQKKLIYVFDIFSDALEQTKSPVAELTTSDISELAHSFYQICSFVFENKDLMKFSNEHFPIYLNIDGRVTFHNIVENQALSFDIDYSLDIDSDLSAEERRQKIISDTIIFLSEDNNFEKELIKFDPLNIGSNKPKGSIEEIEGITFSELIFILCCYLIWKKQNHGDIDFITPEITKEIFGSLKKSKNLEYVNSLSNDKNAYFKIKNKELAIIISLDQPLENTFQTYHRLFSLLDRDGDINSISKKQQYSIPFEKLPFTIFLIDHVEKIDYNTNYDVEPIFKKVEELVNNFNHEIKSDFEDIDPDLNRIALLIQDIFVLGTKDKITNFNPLEIAYTLVKFSEIINEETAFSLSINENIFLKNTEGQFILGNPVYNN